MNALAPCSHLEKKAHISHKEFVNLNWLPIKNTPKAFDNFKNKEKIA